MLLRTLGELRLEGSDFSRPKPLLLLAYLALEGAKPRHHLADMFFMNTKDPYNGLSQALKLLRKSAPGAIEADAHRAWTTLECDATKLLDLADKRQFSECIELYQGPFADTLNVPLRTELENWVLGIREHLAARAREAMLRTAEHIAGQGDIGRAASLAEQAYILPGAAPLEPEQFGRVHDLLIAGASPRAADLRREAEELEVDLTISKREAKLWLEAPKATTTPNNLPRPQTSFIGRDQELVEIIDVLQNPSCRLLTLHGLGGVGKSRLALQAAHEQLQQGSFVDGIYFVPLEVVSLAEMVPAAIAEAVELLPHGQGAMAAQLEQHFGDRHILLVLDALEHVVQSATFLSSLLRTCPNVKVMVTSREVLGLDEEWVAPVNGLRYPNSLVEGSSDAMYQEAILLFSQRAKRARLDFTVDRQNLPHVIRICKLTEGLPLALELAAASVRTVPVDVLADELGEGLAFLEAAKRNVGDRHQSVQAVLEHSWARLTPEEQKILQALSVFVGGFTREAAARVAGATLPLLANLVNKSLLYMPEHGRYYIHTLVRMFAHDKLGTLETEVRERHHEFYQKFFEKHADLKDASSLKRLDEELENLRAAWLWATRVGNFTGFKQISHLVLYFDVRALFREGAAFYKELAEGLADTAPPQFIGANLIDRAWLHMRTGDLKGALDMAQHGLRLVREHDGGALMNGLNTIGMTAIEINDYALAQASLEEAVALGRREEDFRGLASLICNLALTEAQMGSIDLARRHYEEALEIDRASGDLPGMVYTLNNLGDLHAECGNLERAKILLEEGLRLAQDLGHQHLVSQILCNQAKITYLSGDYERAEKQYRDLLREAEASGSEPIKLEALLYLGKIALTQERFELALLRLQTHLRTAWRAQRLSKVYEGLLDLVELYVKTEKRRQAGEILAFLSPRLKERLQVKKANALLSDIDAPTDDPKVELHDLIEDALSLTKGSF